MAKEKEKEEALNPQQEKLKALQAAMSKIEKDYGKGSIMRMGDEHVENVEAPPTPPRPRPAPLASLPRPA